MSTIESSPCLHVLQHEIQSLRDLMHNIAREKKNLTDPDVVRISQLLDEKLNLHYRTLTSH
ncbi:Spo0E like sporulation regulatory protein [Aneurinibacillus soli]|uniref:Spo0E like sporulation regulatory protein n=1 Tax=Aneurinibacillus soli TaxID=1500254 RepID=A0A0U5AUM4_9BACL|nr:aspartyl-phosphate phosphatase Spo0E family protein [Aneurinibacillus soli]PYE63626.1 Spo0E like sporulation regulatory protein [Aneurinibacillus soli]BAU27441.1 Spo0E like sporulation regulatory protein [Aneurinibacillus soli]